MRTRHVLLLATVTATTCVVCGHRAAAQLDSDASLVGLASLPTPLGYPQYGHVRVILAGSADIADACPDSAAGRFVAEYDGELVIATDGSFQAQLVPLTPPVATPSGCAVTDLQIHRVDTVTIHAALPALELDGIGSLTFQTLTAVDNDELQTGNLGSLHARLNFVPHTTTPR